MAFASLPSLELKPAPASSLGQDLSLSAALGNTSLKSLGSEISWGMCLLEVVEPKRLKLNHQRSYNGNPVISTQQMPSFPQTPGTKGFSSKEWLKFWFPFCAGGHSGARWAPWKVTPWREREEPQSFEPGFFFLIPFCRVSHKLLSASLYWTKTMFSFIYLDMLSLPKLSESLQRFLSPSHNEHQQPNFLKPHLRVFLSAGWHNPYFSW